MPIATCLSVSSYTLLWAFGRARRGEPRLASWPQTAAVRTFTGTYCTGDIQDLTDAGDPILEVDHLHDLAKGGEDLPAQMIALCPNCHAVKTRGSTRHDLKHILAAAARRRHDELTNP